MQIDELLAVLAIFLFCATEMRETDVLNLVTSLTYYVGWNNLNYVAILLAS